MKRTDVPEERIQVNIRLLDEQLEAMKLVASELNMKVAVLVRLAVCQFVERYQKGVDVLK